MGMNFIGMGLQPVGWG